MIPDTLGRRDRGWKNENAGTTAGPQRRAPTSGAATDSIMASALMPDRPGTNPETQRRDLIEAGVPERNIHSEIDVSGAGGVASRNGWRLVDAKLNHGDTLVVSQIRIVRCYTE